MTTPQPLTRADVECIVAEAFNKLAANLRKADQVNGYPAPVADSLGAVYGCIAHTFPTPAAPPPAEVDAEWRKRCKVVKQADGDWDVLSPDGSHWLGSGSWHFVTEDDKDVGWFRTEDRAWRALSEAPLPPVTPIVPPPDHVADASKKVERPVNPYRCDDDWNPYRSERRIGWDEGFEACLKWIEGERSRQS